MIELTRRQKEVLALVANGFQDKEIADILHISYGTAKIYMQQTCVKLDAKNRANAVYIAVSEGLIA